MTMLISGQLNEIIAHALKLQNVDTPNKLTKKQKIEFLCDSLNFTAEELDILISKNSPVLRTVRGHCFEQFFDYLLSESGIETTKVGGDSGIDRIVNSRSLQLKTPNSAGTRGEYVEYKTHKTHGAKSETEGMDYYYSISEFAEYLVGLVSYSPLNLVILSRDELPRHPHDNGKIISPFKINWVKHPALNAFGRIGIDPKLVSTNCHDPKKANWLPQTSKVIGLDEDIVIESLFSLENFRVWDMSVRGFAREFALKSLFGKHKTIFIDPQRCQCGRLRADKSDIALLDSFNGSCKHFQVKGVTYSQCKLEHDDPIIDIETQLSRGRVNDHPTQSRLYLASDFEAIILAVDPYLTKFLKQKHYLEDVAPHWSFFSIETEKLARHPNFPNRIKSHQQLRFTQLLDLEITESWTKQWKAH